MKNDRRKDTCRGTFQYAVGVAAIAMLLAVPAVAQDGAQANQRKNRPNIVLLIGDDVGKENVGCYNCAVSTPNIDKIAAAGIRFENAFATAGSCSPSRTTIYTGCYPHQVPAIGGICMDDHNLPMGSGIDIMPTYMHKAGYWCGHFAKLHLGPNADKQWDKIYVRALPGDYEAGIKQFNADRPKDRPFLLSLGFFEAHRGAATKLMGRPQDPSMVAVPPYLPDVPEVRQELAGYYDSLNRLDSAVGHILDWLEKDGLANNTLVIFTGDQGPPFPRAKTTLYDSGLAVPFLVRWPGVIPAGTVQRGQFSLVDVMPTLMEIAGLPKPKEMSGVARASMLSDPNAAGRRYLFGERSWHSTDDHIRCVRTDRFKLIRNYYPDESFGHSQDITPSPSFQTMIKLLDTDRLTKEQMNIFRCPRAPEELYDLAVDPYEFHNVVYEPRFQGVLAELRRALDGWVKDTHDVSPKERMANGQNLRTGADTLGVTPIPRNNPELPRLREQWRKQHPENFTGAEGFPVGPSN